jgi:hypothetical protein
MKPDLDLAQLIPEIERIGDPELRRQVAEIWNEAWHTSQFTALEQLWVDPMIPHPQIEHTRGLVRAALALADVYRDQHGVDLDYDALVAGALLADVSKFLEFEPRDGVCVRSKLGNALPHATLAAHMALHAGIRLEVIHIIVSHSPFAAIQPGTKEAELVYWADQADLVALTDPIWTRNVAHVADTRRARRDDMDSDPAELT